MARKLFVKTYGCQMNVYDSERMSEALAPLGYEPVGRPEDADMVILNTCHIREKAAEKVYSELGRLRALKQAREDRGEGMIVAVAGCVAQAEGAEIMRRAPVVDLVVGPQAYHRLPELVARAARSGGQVIDTEFPPEDKFDLLPRARNAGGVAAFLTVQEGCDKFCTFCVVPYTRGAEVSRPVRQITEEARRLVDQGIREITLLGQNVNAYHGEGPDGKSWPLGRLTRHLAEIDGLDRIRYTTSHPRDMTDELIGAHRDVPQLMPYLHLPVQAGSDRILGAMNRQHTAEDYRRLVERIRAARPDLALSGDFIVGFPGESEGDFEETMALVRDVEYASAFSFKFSARPGTPAANMDLAVPEEAKAERLARLQTLLTEQTQAFNAAQKGRTLPVLLEKQGRYEGQLTGRSPYLQAVHVTAGSAKIGDIVMVRIDSVAPNSLGGVIVEKPGRDDARGQEMQAAL